MVRTRDEILENIRTKFGDDTSDDVLSMVEDLTDTFDDYDTRVASSDEWKKKYEDNDAEWRKRYRDRFFNKDDGSLPEPPGGASGSGVHPMSFDDLFTTN